MKYDQTVFQVIIIGNTNGYGTPHAIRHVAMPSETSLILPNLQPSVTYQVTIGVVDTFGNLIPFGQLQTQTAISPPITWSHIPSVQVVGVGRFNIRWEQPKEFGGNNLQGFMVEYGLRSDRR